jgi:hypothetical protein
MKFVEKLLLAINFSFQFHHFSYLPFISILWFVILAITQNDLKINFVLRN